MSAPGSSAKIATYPQPSTRRSVTFTDLWLQHLQPDPKRQYDKRDAKVVGLIIRVSPGGVKHFSVWYRVNGRAARYGIGRYPTVSLSEARGQALAVLAAVAKGRHPAAERRLGLRDGQLGFAALVDRYVEQHAKVHLKGWQEHARLLRREFVAAWKDRPIAHIERADVLKILKGIDARGTPSAADHALADIRRLFSYAVDEELLTSSPCKRIRRPKPKERERELATEEIRTVLSAATAVGWPYGDLIWLLLLTGQRLREISQLRWDELDLENKLLKLSPERTKNGKAHVVPLSSAAAALLMAMPKLSSIWVFPARVGQGPMSGYSKRKAELDRLSSVSNWRIHDLRRTVGGLLARLGTPPHIISKILNHTERGVTRIYVRYQYLNEMAVALEAVAEELMRVMRGP